MRMDACSHHTFLAALFSSGTISRLWCRVGGCKVLSTSHGCCALVCGNTTDESKWHLPTTWDDIATKSWPQKTFFSLCMIHVREQIPCRQLWSRTTTYERVTRKNINVERFWPTILKPNIQFLYQRTPEAYGFIKPKHELRIFGQRQTSSTL